MSEVDYHIAEAEKDAMLAADNEDRDAALSSIAHSLRAISLLVEQRRYGN